jgi:ubiquinone/menaquinone biosynthesis C-methylase UbiE
VEKIIWQIYACVYDLILERFIPYQQIIDKAITALNPEEGGNYLDAGCGTGNFLVEIGLRCKESKMAGIDYSSAMVKRARKKLIKHNLSADLQIVDLNSVLPFNRCHFDGIICSNVLYAIKDPSKLVKDLSIILKDRGRLILTTPLYEHKMLPVIREHITHFKNKYGVFGKLFFIGQMSYIFIPFVLLILLNTYIKSNQAYHFFKKHELESILEKESFKIIELSLIYGQQNWFIIAEKVSSGEKL